MVKLGRHTFPLTFILLSLFLSLLYSSVVTGVYLHTDDFSWSRWGENTFLENLSFLFSVGRPLDALVYELVALPSTMEGMGYLRLLAIINVALIASQITYWLFKAGVHYGVSLAVSLLIVTLPPFQVFVSFLSTLPHALALSFALGSFFLLNPLEERGLFTLPKASYLGAIALTVVALCLHPAQALYGLVLVGALLALQNNETLIETKFLKRLVPYFVCLGSAMVFYFLTWKCAANLMKLPQGEGREFQALVPSLGERALWFVEGPVNQVMDLWHVGIEPTFKIVIVFVAVLGFVLEVGTGLRRAPLLKSLFLAVGRYFIYACVFVMGFSVSLALNSTPSLSYRNYSVIGSLAIVFLGVPLIRMVPQMPLRITGQRALALVLVCLVTYGSFVARKNVWQYFVYPDSQEFKLLVSSLKEELAKNPKSQNIHFVPGKRSIQARLIEQQNEMGESFLFHFPNIRPAIVAALSTLGSNISLVSASADSKDNTWLLIEAGIRHFGKVSSVQVPPNFTPSALIDFSG